MLYLYCVVMLSLILLQVIAVVEDDPLEPDYILGERGNQRGKVPRAFLETLSP